MIGFLVVDKEAGWTSHDVVARCRKILGERRVGHAGTLDPGATGVLVLGVGRATRLLRYLSGTDKDYQGQVVLGATTTTLDSDGEVTARFDMSQVTLDSVRRAALGLTGEIDQRAPAVSAIKVKGQRLYQLARSGVDVEPPVRRVRVERFEVSPGSEPGAFGIEVRCSSGTYIRSLAADLGTALGGGAYLRGLRRTRVGVFSEQDAHSLQAIEAALESGDPSVIRRPEEGLAFPHVRLGAELALAVAHGRPIQRGVIGASESGPVALLDPNGELLAVYEVGDDDQVAKAAVVVTSGNGHPQPV